MNLVAAVSIVVSSLVMMLFLFTKNFRAGRQTDYRSVLLPWVLACMTLTVVVNIVCFQTLSVFSLFSDVLAGVCPAMLLSMTVWNGRSVIRPTCIYMVPAILLDFVYVLGYIGVKQQFHVVFHISLSVLLILSLAVFVIWGVWRFLYNVKVVLRSGSVWHSVCLSVEMVYIVLIAVLVSIEAAIACSGHEDMHALAYIPLVMLWLSLLALSFRIYNESATIFCHRMERRILESLKVAAVEVPNDVTRTDTAYQEIYDRIVAYFETEKPYLRNDLIIDDLVKVVFSNKLYISRAISQITGRNFCQFVNYYRIMHSIEAFRANPELKATELASLSGFNSLVSFSMAFRLYMNENPSDWIRKERSRKVKSRLM